MAKKITLPSKATSKTARLFSIFGPSPVLHGEDSATYDALLAQVTNAVNPADVIEHLWIRDIVDITWEILRWRRLKSSLLAMAMPEALETTLEPLIADETAQKAGGVVQQSEESEPSSLASELVKEWAKGSRTAINRVNKLLALTNLKMDAVVAMAFVQEFEQIERLDRLVMVAEARRNATLREIDRRRATFAQVLREGVHEVEDAEFKVIEQKGVAVKTRPDKSAA